jgi:DNA polymerase III subunit epsilon
MVGKFMTNNNFQNSRQFKGRSLLVSPSDYTVIDIETTDFNFFYGDIIEVGAIKVRNNVIVDKFSELIKIPYSVPSHITKKNRG